MYLDQHHLINIFANNGSKSGDFASGASNYINGNGIIAVELIENPKVDVLRPTSFDRYIR